MSEYIILFKCSLAITLGNWIEIKPKTRLKCKIESDSLEKDWCTHTFRMQTWSYVDEILIIITIINNIIINNNLSTNLYVNNDRFYDRHLNAHLTKAEQQ